MARGSAWLRSLLSSEGDNQCCMGHAAWLSSTKAGLSHKAAGSVTSFSVSHVVGSDSFTVNATQKNNTEHHATYCSSGRSPWPACMSLHCTALLPDVRPGSDFPTAACDDARLPARQASSSRACHAAVHSWVSLQPDVANSLPCCSTPLLVQSQTAACTSLGPMHRCVPPHSLSSTAVRALFIVVHASGQL